MDNPSWRNKNYKVLKNLFFGKTVRFFYEKAE